MTYEQIADLDGIPRMLGRPLYPGGAPMRKDQISFGDHTYEEIYMKRCGHISRSVVPDFDDEHLLRNYVIYYIHAPLFASEYLQELLDKDLEEMSLDNLIMECLDYGLDPL